jgi:hypothetical protein
MTNTIYKAVKALENQRLKGIDKDERQRRNSLIIERFQFHEAKNLPWMARISANEPEVVIEITGNIGEPVGVYSWHSRGNWLSVSVNQVAQSVNGKYEFLEFGKNEIQDISIDLGELYINGTQFISPPELVSIYAELIMDIENMA